MSAIIKCRTIKISLLLFLCVWLSGAQAQESSNASGGEASGVGGTVSFSVGQVLYSTLTGINGSVAQGVQQPYEISVLTEITEAKGISLKCSAYPNPTTDHLTLKIESEMQGQLVALLFDNEGRLIEKRKIENGETNFSMNTLAVGTYFLKIIQVDKEIKTFKIVKN